MSEAQTPLNETVEMDTKYTKKITATRMCPGGIPKPEPGQTIWLFSLYGQVEKIEVGNTEFGPFLRLLGDFIGEPIYSGGETVSATSAILPAIAEQVIRNHLAAVGFGLKNDAGEDIGAKTVTFAMDIGVDYSKAGSTGYTWVVKPVGATKKSPLMLYRDAIKAKRLPQVAEPVLIEGKANDVETEKPKPKK